MSQLVIDIFFSTVFLLLLILLAKIRVNTFENNKDSYRYTFGGISVLGVVSIIQMMGHQDLFESIPFLSEPIYRELVLTIGVVSGVALMIAGASIWLPGKNRKTKKIVDSESSSRTLDIENTILHTPNSKSVLKRFPGMISRDFNFNAHVIFTRQNRLNKYVCTDYANIGDNETKLFQNIDFTYIGAKRQAAEIKSKIPHDYYLPILVTNRAQIIILFRKNKGETVTDTERKSLEGITRALSYRLNNDYIVKKEKFYSRCWEYSGQIRNILTSKNSISSNLKVLHSVFNQAIGAEYFSLAILGKKQTNPKVYTVGINGNILLDGGNSSIMKNAHFRKIMNDKKSVIVNNINEIDDAADSMFVSCGQCSFMAQPIVLNNQVVAILTLGHSAASHFSQQDLLLTKVMAYSMASAIESELNQRSLFERDRCLAAINGFESAVKKATDINSILKSAVDLISNNISTTMVRVSILDNFRTQLKTIAVKTARPMADLNTDDSLLSKELTCWHQIVAEEGRLLLINQNDAESRMGKSEIESLLFTGVQSALIIPIVVNDRTFGIITLGEMRAWERTSYNSTTISFCKTIAAKIADTIKLQKLSRIMTINKDSDDTDVSGKSDNNLLRRLKVPMTNLQGSLEVLKIKGFPIDGDANRILSQMEESSNDIVNLLNDY
ncbi:MAG: GAF domain-containing protein [candidate division Zixibacteria bacterium]|nr:GAF domain-containing protein [candidate division Zixibacteria bacterium]